VLVKPGDRIAKGQTAVLLEAMKMEWPLKASDDGVVAKVNCREGELVQPDVPLVEFEGPA
jgi:urea carboxylase